MGRTGNRATAQFTAAQGDGLVRTHGLHGLHLPVFGMDQQDFYARNVDFKHVAGPQLVEVGGAMEFKGQVGVEHGSATRRTRRCIRSA